MSEVVSAEELNKWQRRFAVECNNRAWRLSEQPARSAAEDDEMLAAAYAAAYHWSKVGTALHAARAKMLLAHVLALTGQGAAAMANAQASFDYVIHHDSPAWEIAFAHAILANAAAASGDAHLHRRHYDVARGLGERLPDPDERRIFSATFARVPKP